jgi:hypothetical protein
MKPGRNLAYPKSVYRLISPETIRWVVDLDRTLVINELRGEVHVLHGLESAIWSWLSLGYSFSRLVSFAGEFLKISSIEAQDQIIDILDSWVASGLLEETNEPGLDVEQVVYATVVGGSSG